MRADEFRMSWSRARHEMCQVFTGSAYSRTAMYA